MSQAIRQALRIASFAGVVLVVICAGLSAKPVPELFKHQDKLHHLAGFAALAFTARRAFPRLSTVWLLASALSISALIELGQELLPSRTPSLEDMLANLLGVLLGWIASHWPPSHDK